MGVCSTMHWQTSGRPVQELNVCTVVCVRRDKMCIKNSKTDASCDAVYVHYQLCYSNDGQSPCLSGLLMQCNLIPRSLD